MWDELERFERGEFDPAGFSHGEHVRIGHALLSRHAFAEALPRMARGIRTMALRADRIDAYNETITTAFLSLIAERLVARPGQDFTEFAACNPNLFDRRILSQRYSPERLSSCNAKLTFLLPDHPELPVGGE